MTQQDKTILLDHGSGGSLTHELVKNLFAKYFANEYLSPLSDSAVLKEFTENAVFTTDSYVVRPLFFPGGNIGKLAICGTVNDLAVAGARPKFISCGMIIEEGFAMKDLEEIVTSMANAAKEAGVMIVTGDTKVVEKGACDGIFINTAGIGEMIPDASLGINKIESSDLIIINGNIGDHGMAIMAARENLGLTSSLKSDCAALSELTQKMIKAGGVKFMRDPTRGGVATTLCEIAAESGLDIEIIDNALPIDPSVAGISEVLGIDPLYSANEGKVIIVVSSDAAQTTLDILRSHPLGKNAAIIGDIISSPFGERQGEGETTHVSKTAKVYLETSIGTKRRISMLTGAQLPRIC